MRRGTAGGRRYGAALAAGAVTVLGLATGQPEPTAAALLAATGSASESRATTSRLLAWIVLGAVAGGALAWALGTAGQIGVTTRALVGLGVALGGGVGAVGHLGTSEDRTETGTETVTVPADDGDGPEAADDALPTTDDLFETHPDPVLYFGESEGSPVVRAVNPAFEDRFGISASTAGETPLPDALMTADSREDLAERAAREPIDRTVTCETVDGPAPVRLRSVPLAGEHVHGYVLFTPADQDTAVDRGADDPGHDASDGSAS